jgi:methylenetetrahydrofolate dehydrogenase (NADP+)/methenyltetrahydrofolate cyclohydrolase/formyltetrahydrofolate synthetase
MLNLTNECFFVLRYALAADIQTIPGLPTAPGYLNVDIDPETGEIDGLF